MEIGQDPEPARDASGHGRTGAMDAIRVAAAGLVVGIMGVSIALSVAALIFRGPLAGDFGAGAGWALVGVVIIGTVAGLGSTIRGLAAGPQDAPSVVVAAVAAALAVEATDPVATLATFVIIASAVIGVMLLVLGRQRLGGLVRFVPYPVVAGFLGGTGVVLVAAGWDLLTSGGVGVDPGLRLVPGLVLAVALVLIGRLDTPAILPAVLIVLGVVGYHLGALAVGVDASTAATRGLVLGPFPGGQLLDLGVAASIGDADWGALVGQAPAMIVLALLVTLGLLVNTGALEQELDDDADANAELRVSGLGLLLAAPFAGLPGYAFVGDTVMGRRIGGASRIPPLLAAALAAIVLVVGPDLLSLVPVLVPGALLVTIGLDFLLSWVWDVRRQVRPLEHLVIIAIVVVVAMVGFLQGVGLGILAATILFVVRYSRIPPIRRATRLGDRHSHVQRSPASEALLRQRGQRVLVVELQGFVFFGTAEQVVTAVLDGLDDADDVDVVVLDLKHVTGLDSSANAAFRRLARLTAGRELEVVFSGGGDDVRASLAPVLNTEAFSTAADLDHALEDLEETLLAHGREHATHDEEGPDDGELDDLWAGAAVHEFGTGDIIVTAGDVDHGLFLLEAGRAAVAVHGRSGSRHAVLLPGTVIGELSLLSGRPANATVVCQTDCVVRHFSGEAVAALAQSDPARAAALYRFIARRLAGKLDAADRTIAALD